MSDQAVNCEANTVSYLTECVCKLTCADRLLPICESKGCRNQILQHNCKFLTLLAPQEMTGHCDITGWRLRWCSTIGEEDDFVY